MTTKNKAELFQLLDLPRREVESLSARLYRVYSDHKNFVVVEAESAQTALEKSAVKNPQRITPNFIASKNILDFTGAKPTASAEPAPALIAQPEETPALPEVPLSGDDVEKLLQSDQPSAS